MRFRFLRFLLLPSLFGCNSADTEPRTELTRVDAG